MRERVCTHGVHSLRFRVHSSVCLCAYQILQSVLSEACSVMNLCVRIIKSILVESSRLVNPQIADVISISIIAPARLLCIYIRGAESISSDERWIIQYAQQGERNISLIKFFLPIEIWRSEKHVPLGFGRRRRACGAVSPGCGYVHTRIWVYRLNLRTGSCYQTARSRILASMYVFTMPDVFAQFLACDQNALVNFWTIFVSLISN